MPRPVSAWRAAGGRRRGPRLIIHGPVQEGEVPKQLQQRRHVAEVHLQGRRHRRGVLRRRRRCAPGIIKGRHRGRRRLELPPWRRGGGCSSSMPRPSPPAPPSASPVAEAAELELTAAGPASCIRNLLGADVDLAGLGAELGQPLRAHPCARLIILTSPCSIMLAPTLAITLARSPLRSFLRSHLCDGSITKGSGEHYFLVRLLL